MEESSLSCKLNFPLFGVVWTEEDTIVVAGGGGSMKSGVKNKLVLLKFDGGELVDDSLSEDMGDQALIGLELHPSGSQLLGINHQGRLKLFELEHKQSKPILTKKPELVPAAMSGGPGAAKKLALETMALSPQGRYLAVGFRGGQVELWEWSVRARLHTFTSDRHVKDVKSIDVRPVGEGAWVASVWADGACRVWPFHSPGWPQDIYLPRGVAGKIATARFARSDEVRLVVLANDKRAGARVLFYELDELEEFTCVANVAASPHQARGLAVSPGGDFIAVGDSEGYVQVLSTVTLKAVQRRVLAHDNFITDITFAPNSLAVASVSGDSSVSVTPFREAMQSTGTMSQRLLLFLVIVVLLALLLEEGALADDLRALWEHYTQWQPTEIDDDHVEL